MYMLSFFIHLLFLLSSAQLLSSTIHVLIAGDKQRTIKESVKQDIKRIHNETKILSSKIGLKYHLKGLLTDKVSSDAILNWIEKAQVKKDDIFLFYFSGHGLRSQAGSKWPRLYFSKRQETLELQTVMNAIKRKHARLNLILCDACNNLAHRGNLNTSILGNANADGLKALFMRRKGLIAICAAKPNNRAWGSKQGGLMTLTFLSQLWKESERLSPSWKHLGLSLKKTASRVNNPLIRIFEN